MNTILVLQWSRFVQNFKNIPSIYHNTKNIFDFLIQHKIIPSRQEEVYFFKNPRSLFGMKERK